MKTLLDLQNLAARCNYPGLQIEVVPENDRWWEPPFFLRVICPRGTCNTTGEPHSWKGRKWRLSPHMTDGEVVWTAFKAILTCLEHEAREQFKFDGVAVADSHVDIHKLRDFMADPTNRAERAHP